MPTLSLREQMFWKISLSLMDKGILKELRYLLGSDMYRLAISTFLDVLVMLTHLHMVVKSK